MGDNLIAYKLNITRLAAVKIYNNNKNLKRTKSYKTVDK